MPPNRDDNEGIYEPKYYPEHITIDDVTGIVWGNFYPDSEKLPAGMGRFVFKRKYKWTEKFGDVIIYCSSWEQFEILIKNWMERNRESAEYRFI